MRRVPGLKPGSLVAYVPEAFGNRSEAEPVRVWLRVPSEGDKRAHLCELADRIEVTGDGKTRMAMSLTDVFARKGKAIERFVDHVDSYLDADGAAIVTGSDLWTRGELAVCNEVDVEIERLLGFGAEEKKSSSGSCDSSSPASSAADGAATSATPTSSASATATGQGTASR